MTTMTDGQQRGRQQWTLFACEPDKSVASCFIWQLCLVHLCFGHISSSLRYDGPITSVYLTMGSVWDDDDVTLIFKIRWHWCGIFCFNRYRVAWHRQTKSPKLHARVFPVQSVLAYMCLCSSHLKVFPIASRGLLAKPSFDDALWDWKWTERSGMSRCYSRQTRTGVTESQNRITKSVFTEMNNSVIRMIWKIPSSQKQPLINHLS